jgi:hypothetical protein
VFPFLQSLAFLCWVAPKNEVANFIGGGIGGMGFLNLSLDWSNVSAFNDMGSKLTWISSLVHSASGVYILPRRQCLGDLGAASRYCNVD